MTGQIRCVVTDMNMLSSRLLNAQSIEQTYIVHCIERHYTLYNEIKHTMCNIHKEKMYVYRCTYNVQCTCIDVHTMYNVRV